MLLFLVFLLWGTAGGVFGRDQKQNSINRQAQRAVAEVDSLLNLQLHDEAVASAQKLYSSYNENPYWGNQVENRLAIALLRHGDYESALPLLENQVVSKQGDAMAHRNLGACLVGLGRRGRALSEYQQVVELEPRDGMAHLEYGQLMLDFRMYKDAFEEIQTASHLCGQCLEVQPALAQYYFAVKKPALAVEPLTKIWQETGNAVARRNLLKAFLESGQDRAVLDLLLVDAPVVLPLDEWQQLLAAEGRLGETENSLLVVSYLQEPNNDGQPLAQVMEDSYIWGQTSHNLMIAGLNTSALVAVDKAIGLAPGNVVYRNNRVVLLQRLNRYKEAEIEWEKVLTLDPSLKGNQQK